MKARIVGEMNDKAKGDIYRAVAQISYIVYFASLAEMFGQMSEQTFVKYMMCANFGLKRAEQVASPKGERQGHQDLEILRKYGVDCFDCFRKPGLSHEENAYTLHTIAFFFGVCFRFPAVWGSRTVKRFLKIYERNYKKIKLNQVKPSVMARQASKRIGHTKKDKGNDEPLMFTIYGENGNPFTEEHLDRIAAVLWWHYKKERR